MTNIQTATGLQAVYGQGTPGEYIGDVPLQGILTEAGSPLTGMFWYREGVTFFQRNNSTKVFELPATDIKTLVN